MTVTLETLRADFDAKHGALLTVYTDARYEYEWVDLLLARAAEATKAQELLDIAHAYGLQAAMLYKLSDGAIDPRKEDA